MISRITVAAYAVVATVATFLVAVWVNADPQVPADFGNMDVTRDMTIVDVLLVTIVMALLSLGVAAVLDRFIGNGKQVWSIAAIVILAFSMVSVFSIGVTGFTLVWQLMLHLVFGLLLIWGFWRTWDQEALEGEIAT